MKNKSKFKQTEIGMIPEDWKIERLKDITSQIFSGGTPNTRIEEYWNGNLPWLSSGETRQTFIRDTERKITKEGVDNSSTRLAKKEDVVVAGAGQGHTRGQPSFCLIDTYINQSVVVLRANKEKLTPFFLFYNLLSRYDELRQLSDAQSSRGSLTTKLLADLFIKLPTLKEQEIVSKLLSDLDFKIELNQQMNKTLEAIGQVIFKKWFVDFEFPNEKGKPYKSSGGEMVESELGKIPKGWKIGSVLDEYNLTMGQSPPGNTYNEISDGTPFFQGRTDFGFRYPTKRIFCNAPARFAEPGDTLVSVRAPVGDINMANVKCCIGRGVAAIRHKTNSRSYTYYSMQNLREGFLHFEAEGTVFGSIGKTDFEKMRIIIPSKEMVNLFEKKVYPLDNVIENNSFNIEVLSQIRDSLLPRLMSGKIRVPVEVKA